MSNKNIISNSGDGGGLGLDLGLGLGLQNDESPATVKNYCYYSKIRTTVDLDHHPPSCNNPYPSLTLALLDDEVDPPQATSSPTAILSSFSNSSLIIKRETSDQELLDLDQVVDKIPSSSSSSSRPIIHLDDDNGNARKKLRLTKEQSALLEDSFKHNSTLNPRQKQELATKLNLRTRQVEVWFQNRRARTKLKQTEVEYEVIKKCCETLTEENKRLQKELQELKSTMKKTPPPPAGPLYVHVPASSLKICPSCEKISGGNSSNDNTNNNNGASPRTALLISTKVHPQYSYNKTNYSFTQTTSPAAC